MINVYPNTEIFTRCLSCCTVHELFDIEIRNEESYHGYIVTLCNNCIQEITGQHRALREVLKTKDTSDNKELAECRRATCRTICKRKF